jgi:hypothetical protein
VDDATGRSTGYLSGNDYWLGSVTNCRNIVKEKPLMVKEQKGNTGLGLIRKKQNITNQNEVNCPFIPRYGTIKISLTYPHVIPNVSI